jgi:hypothetical protein
VIIIVESTRNEQRRNSLFSKMLAAVIKEKYFLNRRQNIFNVNDSSIQLINKSGKIGGKKGAKDVHVLIPRERRKM